MKKILVLLVVFLLTACSSMSNLNHNEKDYYIDEIDNKNVLENNEDLFDMITVPYKAMAIDDACLWSEASYSSLAKGFLRKGDIFEVFETIDDGNTIWSRIGTGLWVQNTNNKLKKIPYNTEFNFDYTYIKHNQVPLIIDTICYDGFNKITNDDGYKPNEIEYKFDGDILFQRDIYSNDFRFGFYHNRLSQYEYYNGSLFEFNNGFSNLFGYEADVYEEDEINRINCIRTYMSNDVIEYDYLKEEDLITEQKVEYNGNLVYVYKTYMGYSAVDEWITDTYLYRIDNSGKILEEFDAWLTRFLDSKYKYD